MAATFFQSASWITAGTANAGQGNSTYKDVSVTGAAVGDLLIAVGGIEAVNVGGASVRSVVTQSGTTSAWTLSQPGVIDSADCDVIGGFATVSVAGTITVRVQVRAETTTNHMGAGVLLIPAAEWSGTPTWQGTSGNGFASSDADGRLTVTPTASATIFHFGTDWNATAITANNGTPASANIAVRVTDTGIYSVWSAWWTSQAAASTSYGPSGLSGGDWAGVVLNVPAAASGTNYTATPADNEGITDSAAQVVSSVRTAGDSEPITDSAALVASSVRTADDAEGITDSASAVASVVRTADDPVALSDDTEVTFTGGTVFGPSEWGTDDATLADPQNITVTPGDPLGITDTTEQVASVVLAYGDAVGLADGVTVDQGGVIYDPSEWGTADANLAGTLVRTPDDPVGISDQTIVYLTGEGGFLPSGWGTANVTLVAPGAYVVNVGDPVGISDTPNQQEIDFVYTQDDAEGITDAVSVTSSSGERFITSADSEGITDAVSVVFNGIETVADFLAITDSALAVLNPLPDACWPQMSLGENPTSVTLIPDGPSLILVEDGCRP